MQTSPAGTYPGAKLAGWLTTTDHKRIGALYLITSFSFFLLAGCWL
jgi:cytochrome c oxidase subunit 1